MLKETQDSVITKIGIITNNQLSLSGFIASLVKTYSWTSADTVNPNDIKSKNLKEYQFLICILECLTFEEIIVLSDKLQASQLPILYVTTLGDKTLLGPLYFPARSAGIGSALLYLIKDKLGRTPAIEDLVHFSAEESRVDNTSMLSVFHALTQEVKELLGSTSLQNLKFVDKIQVFDHNGSAQPVQFITNMIEPNKESNVRSSNQDIKIMIHQFLNSQKTLMNHRDFFVSLQHDQTESGYKNVGIIGGGTAGYLSAIALKKKFPELPVTLIESSKIPIIGVGEATTPDIRKFLFDTLGFNQKEFYQKVQPTWKLGIKYVWGQPGDSFFNYPFDATDIVSSYISDQHINHCSLSSFLMSSNASFVLGNKNDYQSLSKNLSYAFHLDNKKFVLYLQEKAREVGINFIDAEICDASLKKDNTLQIDHLIAKDGRKFTHDLWVDCTGFYSFLLEKTLGSEYISFENSLYANTALVGSTAHNGEIKPYTQATTMNNGWSWSIPMWAENHHGYVYSDKYCTSEEAEKEMHKLHPSISDLRQIKFKTGRHSQYILGNVVSVGNSYGFVEPLESTGIHMIIHHIKTLTDNFKDLKSNSVLHNVINKNIAKRWDYLKNFLAIHYKFNFKKETEFWKDCRNHVDISGFEEIIDLYKSLGPLTNQSKEILDLLEPLIHDDLFGLYGIDTILLGQGLIPNGINKFKIKNDQIWNHNIRIWKEIASKSVPLGEDFKILYENPHLI